MTILVTNDDGDSEGVRILLTVAKEHGSAYALIPNQQRSAVSKSLTLHKVLRITKKEPDIFEISGTPSDAVLFSLHSKEFPKPQLVVSGINFGDNTSLDAILSSGTIGACWEALMQGIPAIAFSYHRGSKEWNNTKYWGDRKLLKHWTATVMGMIVKKIKRDTFYSVNFPKDLTNPKIVFTKTLQRTRFKVEIEKRFDPHEHPYYWLSGDFSNYVSGTDTAEVCEKNNITITEISLKNFDIRSK